MAKQVFDVQGPRVLNDEEIWIRCRQWSCETTNTYWLLLFKNYNDPDPFSIRQYYPHASQKTIIMTTWRPGRVKRTILQVQLLSSTEDGLAILQIRSQHENVKSDPHAIRPTERFESLPLAIATAGAYLETIYVFAIADLEV